MPVSMNGPSSPTFPLPAWILVFRSDWLAAGPIVHTVTIALSMSS